ncbi:MAG TPA: hypothetical protein VHM31_19710 [Polyangia bacterium]|nr:hypothetical protein [Polyangia bacterium]
MLAVAVAALAATLAATPTRIDPPPGGATGSVSLAADFVLKTVDAAGTETVSGALSFVPGGEICVAVKSPRLQEMRLSPREMVIYYPDRDLAFVAHLAPPMLDALAAGLVDPASTLPAGSKLLERKRANGELLTRWRVVDGSGKELGELRAVENRMGARSIELVDGHGQPQRRFTFGDRVRVGIRTVPRTVVADYYAPGGARQREEQWTLDRIARFDPQKGPVGCAKLGAQTKIQPLQW